jgi:hypothetical protein
MCCCDSPLSEPSDKGELLEHLNTPLYRECNKYRPPTGKGEYLEDINTPVLVIPLCLSVIYIYYILCKVRCLGVLVIPLCLRVVYMFITYSVNLRQRGITRIPKHITLQSM